MASIKYKAWSKAVLSEHAFTGDESGYSSIAGDDFSVFRANPTRPPFYLWYVPSMQEEPILKLGMGALKGLTAMAEFEVECDDPSAQEYLQRQIDKWRSVGLHRALDCLDYGFAGYEVMFRPDDLNRPVFHELLPRAVGRVYPRTKKGRIIGCHFRTLTKNNKTATGEDTYLANPKSFWAVHNRHIDPINGRSQYVGAHLPFLEVRRYMGVKDIRAVWTRKFSVNSIAIQYPRGFQTIDGVSVSNQDIAALIAERYRASGVVLIEKAAAGSASFEFAPIAGQTDATGLMSVGEALDDEMLEGIEIHPEIVRSNGTGSYNGREIPMLSCLSRCTFIANDLTQQAADQIFRPLMWAETGCEDFTIKTVPLQDSLLKRGDGEGKGLTEQPPTPGKNEPPDPFEPTPETDPLANQPQ